jgi:uncharacterized membrane protein
MNLIVNLFNSNKKTNLLLIFFISYCMSLLLFRAKMTNSIYLFFLIWNLFLAIIPYAITSYISINAIVINNKLISFITAITWLLFLPNSFYIITDLVHIVRSSGSLFYLDLVIISSFATIGFLLGLLSLIEFEKLFISNSNRAFKQFLIPIICLLCGFGIYIGRILRYNSWDVISNPFQLFIDLFTIAFSLKSILFATLFGTFIYFSYLFKQNKI